VPDPVDSLILDLLEWIGPDTRTYAETIDAWRTSCPRLPVWEEANDRGFVERRRSDGAETISVTPAGWEFVAKRRPDRPAARPDGEDVLRFWFPDPMPRDEESLRRQLEWWFRGGTDAAIAARFAPLAEDAARGALDDWAGAPRSRLALILVLDQFPRSLFRDSPRAYAQDAKARALALDGIERGHYAALASPFEQTFFAMPLGHSEELHHLEHAVALTEEIARRAPPELRRALEHSAAQARGHRDVVARFGRQPHRNAILGRESTPEEREYLARGDFVHTRSIPQ
jgi:uncharacterized protein (DUF924 family)